MSRASAKIERSEVVKILSGGNVPSNCKNTSADNCMRALRITGPARIVVPISDNSTNKIHRTGLGARGRNRPTRRSNSVATAQSGSDG